MSQYREMCLAFDRVARLHGLDRAEKIIRPYMHAPNAVSYAPPYVISGEMATATRALHEALHGEQMELAL